MSKVITFSRVFPSYHPKAGQPTYFVEKIWDSLDFPLLTENLKSSLQPEILNFIRQSEWTVWPKHHTIRAGHRFKVGDKFSPRVWSGKPYNSKQIIIAPDIEVKKVWDFKITVDNDYVLITINDWPLFEENMTFQTHFDAIEECAKNDGLEVDDFKSWFKYPSNFDGQIICWNDQIEY